MSFKIGDKVKVLLKHTFCLNKVFKVVEIVDLGKHYGLCYKLKIADGSHDAWLNLQEDMLEKVDE